MPLELWRPWRSGSSPLSSLFLRLAQLGSYVAYSSYGDVDITVGSLDVMACLCSRDLGRSKLEGAGVLASGGAG